MINAIQNPQVKIVHKKHITNPNRLKQVVIWNLSDFKKTSSLFHTKTKISFETTTEFLDSCINFQKDEIESMLASGINIDCADIDNLTAMHQACINCNLDLVLYLLLKDANINAADKEGWTPLHIAASIGSLELAKLLIDNNASMDSVNNDGELPISLVNKAEYPKLNVFFKEEMNKRHIDKKYYLELEEKIMMEDVHQWRLSGKYNPPIDTVNKSTPLHIASSKQYLDVLEVLIPILNKSQLNAQDIDGWTSLHSAAHWGNRVECNMLIRAGADIDILTNANEKLTDIVDPDLKDDLLSDIRQFQLENAPTPQIADQVSIRSVSGSKRRSSIARLSVENKKQNKSKDPVLERIILSNATMTSAGVDTDSHEQSDLEAISSSHIQSLYQVDELDESKVISSNEYFDFEDADNKLDNSGGYCDGDNPFDDVRGVIVHDNFDFSDGAVSGTSGANSSESDNVSIAPEDNGELSLKWRSIITAPTKSADREVKRRENARRNMQTRRCTQMVISQTEGKEDDMTYSDDDYEVDGEQEVPIDLNISSLMETPDNFRVRQMKMDNGCYMVDSPITNNKYVDSPRPRSNPFLSSRVVSRPSVNTIQEEKDSQKPVSLGFLSPSSGGCVEDPNDINSDRYVARPVLGVRRVESTSKNVKISASEFSYALIKVNQQIHCSSLSNSTSISNVKRVTTIANRLVSDETLKQELQTEILSLKEELQEVKNENADLHSALKKSREEQTGRNGGDDRISNLETELAVTKDEKLKLKSQNEALLRVIAKIQNQLNSVMKADWHQ